MTEMIGQEKIKFSRLLGRVVFMGAVLGCMVVAFSQAQAEILVSASAGSTEDYAAREMQMYFYKLTGTLLPVKRADAPSAGNEPLCMIGSPKDWPALKALVDVGYEIRGK